MFCFKRSEVRTIPIKDNDITLSIFDNEIDQMLCELHNIESVDLTENTTEERNDFEQLRKTLSADCTLTFDSKTDNSSELKKIFGVDMSNLPDAYDIQFVKIVQARKHRKKRINKKWLKRYGVKQILVNSKGWKLQTHTEGTYEFVK